MSQVIITKGGLVCVEWNARTQQNDKAKIPAKAKNIFTFLRCACTIEEDVTLADIFRIVKSNKLLNVFISQYSWCRSINQFHAQIEEPMRTESDEEKLEYLEIYWHVENNQEFSVTPGFHGVGKEAPDEEFKSGDGLTRYSVSFTPLYNLADLPVRLDETVDVYAPFGENNPPQILVQNKQAFSLLEVLDAIFDDISFYGGPAERNDALEELQRRVAEISELTDEEE